MKVGFLSLGCPKNLVDGEVMLGLAREAGHEVTPDAAEADVIVVNTCAFIDTAKEESVDAILDMARLKRDGRCRRLVVTGCLAERYRDQLKAEIPEIDAVLGTGEVPAIGAAIAGAATTPAAAVPMTWHTRAPGLPSEDRHDPAAPITYLYDHTTPRLLATPGHLAYLKIAEGCNYTCAFCIIPTLRGSYRSRDEDSIVEEARRLVEGGVRELLLISQDTTFFGIDRGARGALARLLRRLDRIEALRWIRLLYLYPTTVTDDVLDAMADCPKVCRYIDLPLQHASVDVLRRMRRPGTREAYDRLLDRIRRRMPDVALRTTFIVGFPGETDEDYAQLRRFVSDTDFDHVGVFTYSHEEGTRAFALGDTVPADTKVARRAGLMGLQRRIVRRRNRRRTGEVVPVMIDGPSPESALVVQGRTPGQAPDIDSVVYLSECDPASLAPGMVVRSRIVGANGYDLIAVPLPGS